MNADNNGRSSLSLACPACGSQQRYTPSTTSLTCTACGASSPITASGDLSIVERSWDSWMTSEGGTDITNLAGVVLTCEGCHATVESTELASVCQFCRGHLVPVSAPAGVVTPTGILPFGIDRQQAAAAFNAWVIDRRVGIDELRSINAAESFTSTYLPLWTFSGTATTEYEGRRGTRRPVLLRDDQVATETDWTDVAGSVSTPITNHVVEAQDISVVQQRLVREVGLAGAVPFQPEYLAGHTAARYEVDPPGALATLRRKVEKRVIPMAVRAAIAGDETQVTSTRTSYTDLRFALILAPVWVLTYIAAGRTWMVLVDGRSGRVEGEYPIDSVKFTLVLLKLVGKFLLAALAVIAVLYALNR